ncbi:MAG: OadG family protein [Candidatus Heimdallarchaeota archaeon]
MEASKLDPLSIGLLATLIGMGFTFLVLALISFSIDLLKLFFGNEKSPQEAKKMAAKADRSKVAIISAAISAYMSSKSDRFIIKKIVPEAVGDLIQDEKRQLSLLARKPSLQGVQVPVSPWVLAGRRELMKTIRRRTR